MRPAINTQLISNMTNFETMEVVLSEDLQNSAISKGNEDMHQKDYAPTGKVNNRIFVTSAKTTTAKHHGMMSENYTKFLFNEALQNSGKDLYQKVDAPTGKVDNRIFITSTKTEMTKHDGMMSANYKVCDNGHSEYDVMSDKALHKMKKRFLLTLPSHLKTTHFSCFTDNACLNYEHLSSLHRYSQLHSSSSNSLPIKSFIAESIAKQQYDMLMSKRQLRHLHLQNETQLSRDILQKSGLLFNSYSK